MRTALVGLLWVIAGCGGAFSKTTGADGGSPSGGAYAAGATAGDVNGGSSTTSGGVTSEPLGDPTNPNYPALPPDSGAFFWRHGLGNWFVTQADTNQDATFDEADGIATWKAEGAAMQSLDLWAQLDHPAGTSIDLSAYSGIAFDAQLTGTNAQLVVAFNATGSSAAADTSQPAQRFDVTSAWRTYQLRFGDIGYAPDATRSIDFIVPRPDAAFVLRIRKLALLCSRSCP